MARFPQSGPVMAWAAVERGRVVALALAGLTTPALAEPLTGACLHFPPGKIQGQAARPGFEIEIMMSALKLAGDTVRLDFYPWPRALALAEQGQVDLLCGCSEDPSRQGRLLLSDPIGQLSIGVFALARPGNAPPPRLAGLAGREVGVVAGYNLVADLRAAGAIPIPVDSDAAGLRMLEGGRFPLFYGFSDAVRFTQHELGMAVELSFRELRAEANYVCFSRMAGNAEARVARFNRGLAVIRGDGTLTAIRERYGLGG